MKRYHRICLVSSGQPFGNPRLVKEAVTFANKGHKVTVLYTSLNQRHDVFDLDIKKSNPTIIWRNVVEHSNRIPGLLKFYRFRKKVWGIIYFFFGDTFDSPIKSFVLYSQELVKAVCQVEADLYIGHNLGAISSVVIASKRFKAKVSFDFEDFHRGECIFDTFQSKKIKQIEDKYVPLLDLATCASPLIEIEYTKLYNKLKIITINNYFPLKYRCNIREAKSSSEELKLFWFSQFIGQNRGLEDIIRAIGLVQDNRIKLTLLGNINESIKSYFNFIATESNLSENQIVYLGPVPENKLVEIGKQHHVGLASEILAQENRNYCLTNKIFIYLLSKNAILFSNTKAQRKFLEQNGDIGLLYEQGDINQIANYLKLYLYNPLQLDRQRKNSGKLGEILNWENESLNLIEFYNLP